MKTKVLVFLLGLELIVLSGCSSEDYYLFDDENWEDIQVPRSRMTKSNPEPQPGNAVPSISDIISDPTVISMMNQAWQNMIGSCCVEGRKEYGFFIYYNYSNQSFVCGEMQNGDLIPYGERAEATLSGPSMLNGANLCASFHTHTSYYYAPNNLSRPAGLSGADSVLARSSNRPRIIYDYSTSPVNNTIPLDGDYELYSYDPRNQ